MTTRLVEAEAVHKAFERTQALRGVSMTLSEGEVVAVTGPSGSGKSTLLLCLAGVLRPEAGRIRYAGNELEAMTDSVRTRLRRREFGLILQFGQLVPELTALDNVALPLLLDRHPRSSSATAARGWLERLGAADLADSLPGELSGGQAQRVAVARALVTGPRVIFADEPTASLDTVNASEVLTILVQAARAAKAGLVLVTHDNRVAAHADREVALRDGRTEHDEAVS